MEFVCWKIMWYQCPAREPGTIVAELKWERSDFQSPHHWQSRGDIFSFKERHPLVMGESALIRKCSQKGYIYYEMKAAIIFFLFCNRHENSLLEQYGLPHTTLCVERRSHLYKIPTLRTDCRNVKIHRQSTFAFFNTYYQ